MSMYSAPAIYQAMDRRQQTFAAKGQIVNTLSSAGHMVFVTAIHLCPCSIKSAKGNMQMNGRGCLPIKFY